MVETVGIEPTCVRIASAMTTPSSPCPQNCIYTLLRIVETYAIIYHIIDMVTSMGVEPHLSVFPTYLYELVKSTNFGGFGEF